MKRTRTRPSRPFRSVKRAPGSLIESIRNAYDPDADFRPKLVKSPVPDFLSFVNEKGKKETLPDAVETASIIEVNRFGAFRIRRVTGSDQFRKAMAEAKDKATILRKIAESGVKLRPAESFKEREVASLRKLSETRKFREEFSISSNTNNASTDPFNEYIPLIGGPFSHQLYLHDFLDMLAKSFEAWNHNPLAHQVVKLTTHFTLGRGVNFSAHDPKVQEAFQSWWDRQKMSERLEFWSDMLSRDGELMVRKFTNRMTKEMFLRWVDPSTIWEIVTDLEDIERVFYYHQQYPTAYQVLYGAGQDRKFDPMRFESSKYVINQIPAEEVYHVKINCSPNEKRGRSDLFSILGYLKRFKDFQTSVVLRAIIQATFAWKNKLKGSDTDVDAFISAFGTDQPEFGSVWVENESSELSPMTSDLKGGSQALADCPGVINAIAVGSGIPKEYIGLSEHGTRATAVVSSEPGVKKFQSRQLILGRFLKDIAKDWSDNEIAAGRIKKGSDVSIDFHFPEIATEDRSAKMKDVEGAQLSGYISKKRAATMSAKELGIEDYDYDEEQGDISDETADSMAALYSSSVVPSKPGAEVPPGQGAPGSQPPQDPQPAPSGGLSGKERRAIKRNDRR